MAVSRPVRGAGAGGAGAKPTGDGHQGAILARLTIRTPNVDIKGKKKTTFSKGASGQVLHEGDTLRTDATAGLAEISYTDGSYTRLGPNTEYSITKLTESQGVRQTQGTLTVGSTWNRPPRSPRPGPSRSRPAEPPRPSKARSSPSCAPCRPSCQFIDLFDPVLVTMGGTQVQLESSEDRHLGAGSTQCSEDPHP